MPHMNSITERWGLTCHRELQDRTPVWNQRHPLHALPQYEAFHNAHRPHQGITDARPLTPLPLPITDLDRLAHLKAHRPDRLGDILHENHHAA
jgi:putative transposase